MGGGGWALGVGWGVSGGKCGGDMVSLPGGELWWEMKVEKKIGKKEKKKRGKTKELRREKKLCYHSSSSSPPHTPLALPGLR